MPALQKELGRELSSSQGGLMFLKKQHKHHSLHPFMVTSIMVENQPVRPDEVTSHKDLPLPLPSSTGA